jgi:undecaprenyl-diphosphatase
MYDGIHSGWRSPTMDAVMTATTELGDWYAIGGSTAALYLSSRPELRKSAGMAAYSWLGAMVVLAGIRAVVNRPRPEEPEPGWFDSAFPSGHATGYFAVATVYALKFPKLAPLLGATGAMLALSRVYLGHHWPTDVLAGAALGAGAGFLTVKLEKPICRMLHLENSRVGVLRPGTIGAGPAVALVTVSF